MIESKLLVRSTIEALNEKHLLDPMDDKLPIRDNKSIWGLIVFKCTGSFLKNENLKIYTSWIRNSKNYKSNVLENIVIDDDILLAASENNALSNNDVDTNLNKTHLSKSFGISSQPEITFISNYISSGKRKNFNSQFTGILTIKLQNMNLNCSLHYVSNYFSTKIDAQLVNYWTGRYMCKGSSCDVIYEASIKSWSSTKLLCKINWFGICLHDKLIAPKSRCQGKVRENLALKLLL